MRCLVLLLCSVLLCLAREPLQFKNGKFRIAQFTDLHYGEDEFTPWGPIQDINSDHVMHSVLNSENPDFVLFTGDSLTGNNIHSNATAYWKYVVSPCLQSGTPWAHVFGNHDDLAEERGDRRTLMTYDMTFNQSYTAKGAPNLPGESNYFIPIYGEDSDLVSAIIYNLDTGGGQIPVQMTDSQVKWLLTTYTDNTVMYGDVPSILSFHIPLMDFQRLYKEGHCVGTLNNPIEELDKPILFKFINTLMPNIKLVTTGHYHENDFCCPGPTKSQLFCQGRHSGYGGYSTVARGSRIIQFSAGKLETWIRMEDKSVKDYISVPYNTNF